MAATTPAGYRAGYCNIGRAERRARYGRGVAATVAAAVFVTGVLALNLPTLLAAAVFVPLVVALEAFLEARHAFCARLALAGRYDFSGTGGDAGTVPGDGRRRADTTMALRIAAAAISLAGLAAVAVTALVAFVR